MLLSTLSVVGSGPTATDRQKKPLFVDLCGDPSGFGVAGARVGHFYQNPDVSDLAAVDFR